MKEGEIEGSEAQLLELVKAAAESGIIPAKVYLENIMGGK